MRLSTYTTQDPAISLSLSNFPIHQQKHPSTPTPQIPILKTGSSFQQLLLVSKSSRQEPRRGFSRLSLRPIASIGEGSVASDSPAKALRRILETPGIHQGPACYDALSAKLVERAGFKLCFTSGKCLCKCLSEILVCSVDKNEWKSGRECLCMGPICEFGFSCFICGAFD